MKIEILLKGKISYKMCNLEERENCTRNVNIELDPRIFGSVSSPPGLGEATKTCKIDELTKCVNKIAKFGHISLIDFSNFGGKIPEIFIRFSSLNSSHNFIAQCSSIRSITKACFIQDFCDFEYSDKILYINE